MEGIRPASRGAANFRINEVRKSPAPLATGEISNGGSEEITSGGYTEDRSCEGGLLELANQLGNVSQACKMLG